MNTKFETKHLIGKSVQKWLKLRGLKAAVLTEFKLIIDEKICKPTQHRIRS